MREIYHAYDRSSAERFARLVCVMANHSFDRDMIRRIMENLKRVAEHEEAALYFWSAIVARLD